MTKKLIFGEEHYKEASDLVKKLKIEDTLFDILDIEYNLFMCPQKNDDGSKNGEPADYRLHNTGWAIYMWEKLGEKIQKPLLFHEIVEIYYCNSGIKNPNAHNATIRWEKKFCEEYLNKSEMQNYIKFERKHRRSKLFEKLN